MFGTLRFIGQLASREVLGLLPVLRSVLYGQKYPETLGGHRFSWGIPWVAPYFGNVSP